MREPQYLMLACPTLRREITAAMERLPRRFPVLFLPEELHLRPEKLRDYLTDFIPRLEGVDYLLLPMGRCGNGTVGIPSGSTTLVLPRCEDCIDLMLSRRDLADVERPKYSYFFTESWLETKWGFIREFLACREKYGPELTASLMQAMYAHYQRFCYVDTGCGDYPRAAETVRPLAETVGTAVERLPGPCGVLEKMLRLELDGDFVLVPPGQTVDFSCFGS